mmetsp:Transcript_27492/g.27151  ORF Transcript_27492/g.27151 Transcript_27492/m.27151 type:complete len:136 (+) Transcript_27492:2-409(+)
MKFQSKYEALKPKYDELYDDAKKKAAELSKIKKEENALKVSIALKKLQLKREFRNSERKIKGWVMESWEKELEKGWKCFTVPEEPEKKREPSPKIVPEKEERDEDEDSDIEREIQIMMKNSSRSRRMKQNMAWVP